MSYMRNAGSGTIIGPLTSDSAEYRYLQQQRDVNNHPVWEDTGVEDAEAAGLVIDGKVAQTIQAMLPAVAAAANNSGVVGRAPFAGAVSKVEYFPEAAINGVATNNRTLQLLNAVAGAGSTVVATEGLGAGTNLTANSSNLIPLSGTPANLNVARNDEMEWQSLAVGTGIADPGGLVVVTFTRE